MFCEVIFMADTNYTLARGSCFSVPVEDVEKLLSAHSGAAALLYLHLLRFGSLDERAAARQLSLTAEQLAQGMDTLRALGLVARGGGEKLPPAQELPEYRAEDIVRRGKEDAAFAAVVDEAQRLLGHLLSSAELKILFGIYDYLSLPAEVIFLLINHCIERCQERQGPGRMPTMRSIEKTAYIWANRDITTLDRAEDHLRAERARREETERVKQALQIRGRELTPTERKYIDAWLELGFTAEALAIAYDRTVIKTGSLHWKYMNSIVSSWHGKGLHSPEEIEKGDCRAPAAASGGEHGGGDLDWMEQQLGLK